MSNPRAVRARHKRIRANRNRLDWVLGRPTRGRRYFDRSTPDAVVMAHARRVAKAWIKANRPAPVKSRG